MYVSRVLGHFDAGFTLATYTDLFDRERHAERVTAALEAGYAGTL